MSQIIIEDAGWKAIMADERLAGARRKLSFHELRLIIDHARNAIADTHPKDGDVKQTPPVSGGGAQSAIAQPSPSQSLSNGDE